MAITPAGPGHEATRAEPRVLGSSAPDAVTLGRLVSKDGSVLNKINYGGPMHMLVFGPNGKGKGTRILMPNLLRMSGSSLVVVDPKGELAAVTAPFRRTLGRVVILNPFGVLTDLPGYADLKSVGYNPLAALDPSLPSFNVEASLLADGMIPVGGKEPHWDESARAMTAAFIMYAVVEAREAGRVPTIARVRELICEASFAPHASNGFEGLGIPKRALEMTKSALAGLRNKASQFTDWNREIQSIASTARRHTEPFDDPEIATDLARNGFDFRDLRREPITVYLILPPNMMERHAKWLRLVLTAAIQGVLHVRRPGEPKTLFMIDEFFALGHLEVISTVWSLVRGYGIQIMPILQDLNQLKKLYPDMWETFVGMAGTVACFAPNDATTAEWMSRRAGDTTRQAPTKSVSISETSGENHGWSSGHQYSSSSTGWSTSRSVSRNTSTAPVKVPVITSHQLRGLHPGYMMLSISGLSNVVPVYAPGYYDIRQCAARARPNPYYFD